MAKSLSYWTRIAGFVLATGCALLLRPATVMAVTRLAPVDINECRIVGSRADVSAYKPIVLSFTNRGATAANVVAFTIDYAGRTERIIDKGTFARNVQIEHAFAGFYNVRYRGPSPSICRVDYVGFSDGTGWMETGPVPATS